MKVLVLAASALALLATTAVAAPDRGDRSSTQRMVVLPPEPGCGSWLSGPIDDDSINCGHASLQQLHGPGGFWASWRREPAQG